MKYLRSCQREKILAHFLKSSSQTSDLIEILGNASSISNREKALALFLKSAKTNDRFERRKQLSEILGDALSISIRNGYEFAIRVLAKTDQVAGKAWTTFTNTEQFEDFVATFKEGIHNRYTELSKTMCIELFM